MVARALPTCIGQGHEEIFDLKIGSGAPAAVRLCETGELWRDAPVYEQSRSVLLVVLAWPGQLVCMQHFADVVHCCSEQHRLGIDVQTSPLALNGIDKLGCDIMNEDAMGDESRRCAKILEERRWLGPERS